MTTDEVKTQVTILSDRGSDIKYGLINNGYKRLTCYAHIIHNLVSKMLSSPRVKAIIDDSARLASYVKNTGLNKFLKPTVKRFVSTRWNSIFVMIDSILKNFDELLKLLGARQQLRNVSRNKASKQPDQAIIDLLNAINKTVLISLRDFLEPFKV